MISDIMVAIALCNREPDHMNVCLRMYRLS